MAPPSLSAVRAALDAPAVVRETFRPEDILLASEADGLPLRRSSLAEGSADAPSGQYDIEFGIPYNSGLRMLSGSETELREWTIQERELALRRCHQAWERNPWAKAGVRLIRNFTVRDGHKMTYRCDRVKRLLESFRKDPLNRVQQYDKELFDQLLIDGELFIRFNKAPRSTPRPAADQPDAVKGEPAGEPITHRVVIDTLPPWWILDIKLDPDFREIRLAYKVQLRRSEWLSGVGTETEAVEIPAKDVLHVAINKLGYEVRGRPELYSILPWLKAYKDFLEDRVRINRLKGAMLYDVSIKGQQPGVIAAKRAQYRTPPPPNSVIVHSDLETWNTVDNKINANDVSEDGRQIKLATAVGFGLPEYALGDGENANRATANAQQLPMLANFADYQDTMANCWSEIYQQVLDAGVRAGVIQELEPELDGNGDPVLDEDGDQKMISVYDAYTVAYPPAEESDPKSLAEALEVMARNRWIDDEEAIRRTGGDPAVVRKKLAQQDAEVMDRVAQGLYIGPEGPDLGGLSGEDEEEEDPDEDGADEPQQTRGENRNGRPQTNRSRRQAAGNPGGRSRARQDRPTRAAAAAGPATGAAAGDGGAGAERLNAAGAAGGAVGAPAAPDGAVERVHPEYAYSGPEASGAGAGAAAAVNGSAGSGAARAG